MRTSICDFEPTVSSYSITNKSATELLQHDKFSL